MGGHFEFICSARTLSKNVTGFGSGINLCFIKTFVNLDSCVIIYFWQMWWGSTPKGNHIKKLKTAKSVNQLVQINWGSAHTFSVFYSWANEETLYGIFKSRRRRDLIKCWIKCVFTSLPWSVVLSADVISTSQPLRQPFKTCPSLFPSFFHKIRVFSYYACALRLPRPTWVSQHDMILI